MTSKIYNIKELQDERIEEYEKEKLNENLEYEENNYSLKVSLVNIDSKYRNLEPKNILDGNPIFLSNNPIYVSENSFEIRIYYPNHNLNVGDKIILQNIEKELLILKDSFFLFDNFNYLIIKLENHNYNKITNYNETDIFINISNFDELDPNKRLLGNIPINSILGYQKIYLKNDIEIENIILNNIQEYFNYTTEDVDDNIIFIKLPFVYSKVNKLNNNIEFTDIYKLDNIFQIKSRELGGIPLSYLNANFPITNKQFKNSQFITRVDSNNIYFNSDIKGNYNSRGGLDKVYISKVINTIEGFKNSDNYIIELKKSYTDVVRVELVSTEIPFVEFNINNNITSKNNKLYWQYIDDGDIIYSVSLPEGSYGPDSLIENLTTEMNKITRLGSSVKEKIYNSFEIDINKNSQEVKFASFKFEKLPHSLKVIKDNNLTNIFKLQIICPNNYVQVGDNIVITNSSKIGDIPASVINRTHEVFEINPANNTFTVIIPVDVTITNLNIEGSGGPYVNIKVPVLARFLFNYNDTLGSLIGFKNVGNENAITKFQHITSNLDDYIEKTIYDQIGNLNVENTLLNLTTSYFYVFMYINDFEGIISNTDTENPFAKILLSGYTGDVMFNTFISSPLEFDNPISLFNDLKVTFKYADGTAPNFRNFDHSFTLRITERITTPKRTQMVSKKINYNESIINRHVLDIN